MQDDKILPGNFISLPRPGLDPRLKVVDVKAVAATERLFSFMVGGSSPPNCGLIPVRVRKSTDFYPIGATRCLDNVWCK